MAANMDGVGELGVAEKLSDFQNDNMPYKTT